MLEGRLVVFIANQFGSVQRADDFGSGYSLEAIGRNGESRYVKRGNEKSITYPGVLAKGDLPESGSDASI
jgi:hypothetical protein